MSATKLFAAMFAGMMILIAVAALNGLTVADVPTSAHTHQIVAEVSELQKMAVQIAWKNDFFGDGGGLVSVELKEVQSFQKLDDQIVLVPLMINHKDVDNRFFLFLVQKNQESKLVIAPGEEIFGSCRAIARVIYAD